MSFNPHIIEAINNAVAFGLEMPGPHELNNILHMLSTKMAQVPNKPSEFLANLKSYIDTYYLSSNQKFCQEYQLNEAYFSPSEQISKLEILDIIRQEGLRRTKSKSVIISNYRMLSATMIELCLKLTNGTLRHES